MGLTSCRTSNESGYHLYRAYDRNESISTQMSSNGTRCYRCEPSNSDVYFFGLSGTRHLYTDPILKSKSPPPPTRSNIHP